MPQYQDSGSDKLANLDAKIPAVGQKPEAQSLPIVLPAAQIVALTPPSNTGYSTTALQTTGNTALASIDNKLTTKPASTTALPADPSLVVAISPNSNTIQLTAVQLAQLTPVSSAGGATSALQNTGNNSLVNIDSKLTSTNAALANIDSKIPAVGQNTVALSSPVVLPAAQITALTPPSNTGYSTAALQTTGNTSLASIDAKLTAPLNSNLAQVAGSATLVGNGIAGAGAQRVTIASDNAPIYTNATLATSGFNKVTDGTNTATVKPASVLALPTDSALVVTLREPISGGGGSINLAQVAGSAVSVGNGVTGIASQRVTIASDNAPLATNSTLATSGFNKITDGISTALVRNSPPTTTDAGLVVVTSANGADLAPLTPSTVAIRHGLVGGVTQALGTITALAANQQSPLRLTPNGALLTQIDPNTYSATRSGGTPPAAEFVMSGVASRLRSLSYINEAPTVVYIQIHLSNTALISGTSVPQNGWIYRIPANSQLVISAGDLGQYGTLLTTGTTARFAISTTRALYTAATTQLALGTYSFEII